MATTDFAPRRAAFRKLHESGCFVIPNPWDIGTACYLRHLGFQALATTSAGFSFSRGMSDADWAVPLDLVLKHIAEIVSATDLPVNADFESGYSHDPKGVAANVRLCVETGVAGLSIEDATGDREKPLYDVPLAVERIQAARFAIDTSASDVVLTARAECFLVGHLEPLRESIRRLQAYAEAGADVLYAPGVRERADIQTIVAAVRPKPVNVLAPAGLKVSDLAELGVRRVSLGSSLARVAWTGFIRASKLIADEGSFAGLDGAVAYSELNEFFRDVVKQGEKR
jgi:2-methylisocitrate lyase-like PEP mutase family enzyme